ncbi:hypothetical protein HETIRDRAFT_382643 [Heterobasidion irregulare TC 32-1]|uniref:Uncharacterized protein n=1 Tax=Heterobasidion irregulare (strain TC 32-1) TaxID=747525 RepID=W4K9N0_HETIT|nr:uncharacterized protein HETIRDRAFT_382643 [Heterobasidion irregulare TC 32-1]ETW82547.1 hypothetical protein HETIRDRAFT_382643 [Heterobasidion irregulare TC 32-1]
MADRRAVSLFVADGGADIQCLRRRGRGPVSDPRNGRLFELREPHLPHRRIAAVKLRRTASQIPPTSVSSLCAPRAFQGFGIDTLLPTVGSQATTIFDQGAAPSRFPAAARIRKWCMHPLSGVHWPSPCRLRPCPCHRSGARAARPLLDSALRRQRTGHVGRGEIMSVLACSCNGAVSAHVWAAGRGDERRHTRGIDGRTYVVQGHRRARSRWVIVVR